MDILRWTSGTQSRGGVKRCGSTSAKACWRNRRAGPADRQYSEQVVKRIHFYQTRTKAWLHSKRLSELLIAAR